MGTTRRARAAIAAVLLAVLETCAVSARAVSAQSPASASVGAGSLSFGAPTSATRVRRGGASAQEILGVTVADGTGVSAGWTVSATAQSASMPTGAAEMAAQAARPCATGSTCTPPGGEVISFPSTLPMAPVPPSSTVVVRAAPGSGAGATATASTFTLLGPGWDSASGQTTWVVTLGSAP